MDEVCAKQLSTYWLDSFLKWGFEMELLATACECFHDCWDIFGKASAHVYTGTPAGHWDSLVSLSFERSLGQAPDCRGLCAQH